MVCAPALGMLLALALDRLAAVRVPYRLLGLAAVAAALVPIVPAPLRAVDRADVPAFVADGTWKRYVGPGESLVPVPLPDPGNAEALHWQTEAGLGFRLPGGYFNGPYGPDHVGIYGASPRWTSNLLRDIRYSGRDHRRVARPGPPRLRVLARRRPRARAAAERRSAAGDGRPAGRQGRNVDRRRMDLGSEQCAEGELNRLPAHYAAFPLFITAFHTGGVALACDLWLVPLVDVLCHSPDNPFAEELALYDKALHEAGLPPVPVYSYMPGLSGDVAPVAGFDYDALHFLRRAYLLQMCGLAVTPVDELGGDYEQLLEMFETTAQQSHLVWHYDHAGAYVPVDFPSPLSNDELLAGGGPLGSSHALLRELEYVARSIGIDPANPPAPPVPPEGPTALEEPAAPAPLDNSPFARERHVWLGLHAAATRSLAQGSMIIFS
jgi:hypothetical protein